VLGLEVADDGLGGGATTHLAFDLRGAPALLLGCVDLELIVGRRVVAAIAGIDMSALDFIAEEFFDRRNDARQGWPS
jgi:hypothetical protein